MRLRIVRGKWVRVEDVEAAAQEIACAAIDEGVEEGADTAAEETSPVLVAPLPGSVWPNIMADPSAITQVVLSKYDDVLPLNRQERISLGCKSHFAS
jgi:transposase